MIEPYNMSQAQRDAAHIEALTKQLRDAQTVITALATNTAHLRIVLSADEVLQAHAPSEVLAEHARDAGRRAAEHILGVLSDRGDLYRQLEQYMQWFYAKQNHSTRMGALRSTMGVARP